MKKRGNVILLSAVLLFLLAAAAILFHLERTVYKTFTPSAVSDDQVVFELPISVRSIRLGGKQSPLILAEAIHFGPYYVISNQLVSAKKSVEYDVTNGVLRVTVEKNGADGMFQLVLTNSTTLAYRRPGAMGYSFRLRSRNEVWTSQSLMRKPQDTLQAR